MWTVEAHVPLKETYDVPHQKCSKIILQCPRNHCATQAQELDTLPIA
jgi:hypothetical protein